jgi:RNA polymerase sigma factor (sigma-70 family)
MDTETLERLFLQHRKTLYSILNRKCKIPTSLIPDMIHEVMLRMMWYQPKQEVTSWQSYMVRIAINVANEWRERSQQKRPHIAISNENYHEIEELMSYHGPESEMINHQLENCVQRSISELSERQRQVVQLHHFDRMTYKEVGKALGITYRQVLRDLTRAHATLRERLHEERERDYRGRQPARRHAA